MEEIQKKIRCAEKNSRIYPAKLREISGMPERLYYIGRFPENDRPSAAIVGARLCSTYGRIQAFRYGKFLSEHGVQVISGMAAGIDAESHKGALEGGTPTFAVLGNGVDICYPSSSRSIYLRITQENGGIISEYEPGTRGRAYHFPARNRIISGLSDLVLVVEARKRSGSLITADLALEQGKEVFSLPGRRIDPLSEGCNRLIAQGAGIVTKPEDVLDFFHIKCKNSCKKTIKSVNALAKSEKMVYSCLDSQPKHLEAVMKSCGVTAGECMTALLNLEMQGLILQPMNQYYVRKII